MGLREKLIEAIYKEATSNNKMRKNIITLLGIIFFFLLLWCLVVLSLNTDKLLEFSKFLSEPFNIFMSIPFLVIGSFLFLWSIFQFVKVKGTPVPVNPPPKLVTTGPYGYVRNPMHTGIFILLFGFGILLRSISLIFIFLPLFILLDLLWLKMVEEPELEKRFGKEYIKYKKNTPMFFPHLIQKHKAKT
jgi:protein-S-isoprenylcysteine O-methyltransferase Ste14